MIESAQFSVVDSSGRERAKRSGYALVLRDPSRIDSFATIAAHAASRLRQDARCFSTRANVDAYVTEWIDFFTLGRISLERAIGLWGELHVLTLMPDPGAGAPCWVGPFGEMFDFVGHGMSLEIKTSLRSSVVSFTLEQIEGRDSGHSVFVRVLRDEVHGQSLDDLVENVRSRLSDAAQFDATLMRSGYEPGDHPELKLVAHEVFAIPNTIIPRPNVTDIRIRSVRYCVDVDGFDSETKPIGPLLARMTGVGRIPRRALSRGRKRE